MNETDRSSICKPCPLPAMIDRLEPGGATNAAYQTSRLRLRFASRTSTDWNWRNGDDWRCRSRHTRGPSSLHARCDAALFRIRFGRVANDEVHDGQEGTVESGVPCRDGAQGLPSRLSALRILHAWSLPLLRRGNHRQPSMRRDRDCRLRRKRTTRSAGVRWPFPCRLIPKPCRRKCAE